MPDMLNCVVSRKTFSSSIPKNASLNEFFFNPFMLNKRKKISVSGTYYFALFISVLFVR